MLTSERIAALLAHSPVIDGHNDFAWELRSRVKYDLDAIDVAADQTASGLHTDLTRMRAGGMGAQFWSVFVSCEMAGDMAVTATLEQIDFVHRLSARYPAHLAVARTADEVELAHADGRIASLIGVEGGHSMNNSMGALRMLYALGARYMTLTHVKNTDWADSATDEPVFGGLSAFGREVVRECNRLGLMADLSHVSPATMHATLDISTAPAFFSHSSARALCDHPRNVPDDVLARVRDTDGVVMVTFVPGFLNETCRDWMEELIVAEAAITAEVAEDTPEWKARRAKWAAANPRPACTIDDVADHIEHVREVAGVGAVGIGSDFDGIIETPDGVTDVSTYPRLLETLADRAWSDSELSGLTWGNALRVLRGTEAAARAATWEPSVATLHGL